MKKIGTNTETLINITNTHTHITTHKCTQLRKYNQLLLLLQKQKNQHKPSSYSLLQKNNT